jgi:hypothetical protein
MEACFNRHFLLRRAHRRSVLVQGFLIVLVGPFIPGFIVRIATGKRPFGKTAQDQVMQRGLTVSHDSGHSDRCRTVNFGVCHLVNAGRAGPAQENDCQSCYSGHKGPSPKPHLLIVAHEHEGSDRRPFEEAVRAPPAQQ